jgi:membrane protein
MKFKNISNKIIMPGFQGQSLYDVSMFFYKGLVEGALTTRASALAFNFFLALFPSIIVIFTLIPFVPIEGFQEQLFTSISDILPPHTFEATKSILDDIINHQHGSLLSLTFILTFYFSTNGVNTMITCFNATYHLKDKRSWIQLKVLSIVLTFVLALLFILTITLQIFSLEFLHSLIDDQYLELYVIELINYSKWLIFVLLLFVSISILYYYGPADKSGWRFLSAGSITATTLSVITSLGFSYYVNNFAQYNQLYGSIGTLLVILLWMYFNSIILLLGFELNASIISAKEKQLK